jgi:hypothetical protein
MAQIPVTKSRSGLRSWQGNLKSKKRLFDATDVRTDMVEGGIANHHPLDIGLRSRRTNGILCHQSQQTPRDNRQNQLRIAIDRFDASCALSEMLI